MCDRDVIARIVPEVERRFRRCADFYRDISFRRMKVEGLLSGWFYLAFVFVDGRSPCRSTCEIHLLSCSGNLAMHQLWGQGRVKLTQPQTCKLAPYSVSKTGAVSSAAFGRNTVAAV